MESYFKGFHIFSQLNETYQKTKKDFKSEKQAKQKW